MRQSSKKPSKLFIIIPTVIFTCIAVYIVFNVVFSPYWGSVYPPDGYLSFSSMQMAESADIIYSKDEAAEDLDYVISCLKRVHPLCKEEVPQEVLYRADSEKASWGEKVTSYELWRSIARVLGVLDDAHTMAAPSFSRHYLTDYLKKMDLGYELVEINGTDIQTLFNENKDLFSYELEPRGINALTNCFQTKEGLTFIGIDTSDFNFMYLTPDGRSEVVTYSEDDFFNYAAAAEALNVESDDSPSYYYSIDNDGDFGLLTVNSCDYDSEYKELLYNFFTEVIESDIDNVIVDLRENSGGNSQVADEFILYLNQEKVRTAGGSWRLGPYTMNWSAREENISHYDDMLFSGDVFVLTSSNTFSSGTMFAEMISDNGFGKIVGEECGNMPESYGEVVVFQTPNAFLSFQISSKHFNRIDESKSDYPLVPDYQCASEDALDVVIEMID